MPNIGLVNQFMMHIWKIKITFSGDDMGNWQGNHIKTLFGTHGMLEIEPLEKSFKLQCLCSAITITQNNIADLDVKSEQDKQKIFSLNGKKQYFFLIQFNQRNPIDWKYCEHISIIYRSNWIKDKRLFIVLYHPVFREITDFSVEGTLSLCDEGYYYYWVEEK